MKKRIIFSLSIIILLAACKAQKPLEPGVKIYKDKEFKVFLGSNSKFLGILEKNGKYIDTLPPNAKPYYWLYPIGKNDVVFDEEKIEQIVKDVLKHKIEKLHQNKEYLGLSFYFDKDGSIGMISMRAKAPTIISTKEIYKIQTRLKQEIKATFKGETWKDYGVIERGMPSIRF